MDCILMNGPLPNQFIIRVNLICAMIARANLFDFVCHFGPPAPCFSNWVQCSSSHSKTYVAFPFFLEFMRTILSRGFFHGTSKIATLDKTHVWNVAIQTILKNLRKKNICYIDCDIWIQDYTHNYRRFPISTFWNTLEKIFHISFKDSEKRFT